MTIIIIVAISIICLFVLWVLALQSKLKFDEEVAEAKTKHLIRFKNELDAMRLELRNTKELLSIYKERAKAMKSFERKAVSIQACIAKHASYLDRRAMCKKWLKAMDMPTLKVGGTAASGAMKERMGERFYKIQEELHEAREAWYRMDMKAFCDAITDIIFAAECAGAMCGWDSNEAFKAVFDSNMLKDKRLFCTDKHGKGADYKEPDFSKAFKKR